MSERVFQTNDEDVEREKLPGLAKRLGWEFHSTSKEPVISGQFEGKTVSVGVQRRTLQQDILECTIDAPSSLIATIYHENWVTTGGKALASILSKLGLDVYCDIQTGSEFIDAKFFVEVDATHRPMMEALVANNDALALLEHILRRFDQISFTGKGIHLYRFIEKGDLDLEKTTEALRWLRSLDRFDGIYL